MPSLVGQTLRNCYRVDDQVGRGGMAEVYKLCDEQRATFLAFKLLREDLAHDRILLRRFKREARTLINPQYPNFIRFYALEQDNDLAFMLMDYIVSTTLRKVIFRAKQQFPPAYVLEIMRPICSALHYAHQINLVDCDANPGYFYPFSWICSSMKYPIVLDSNNTSWSYR
ncbi:MAG: protein kinase [Anaerolineales bacterium]|nr:protein kinase [Anaerolineales bacterium]